MIFCFEVQLRRRYKINEIVNTFLLAGDKFMSEMHIKQPGLLIVLVDHLLKTKKEFRNLRKREIQTIFSKMNLIMLVFNKIWLMEILKVYREEQLLIKF